MPGLKLGSAQLRAKLVDSAEAAFQKAKKLSDAANLKGAQLEALNGLGMTQSLRRRASRSISVLSSRSHAEHQLRSRPVESSHPRAPLPWRPPVRDAAIPDLAGAPPQRSQPTRRSGCPQAARMGGSPATADRQDERALGCHGTHQCRRASWLDCQHVLESTNRSLGAIRENQPGGCRTSPSRPGNKCGTASTGASASAFQPFRFTP